MCSRFNHVSLCIDLDCIVGGDKLVSMLSGMRRMASKTIAGKCKVVIVDERTRSK